MRLRTVFLTVLLISAGWTCGPTSTWSSGEESGADLTAQLDRLLSNLEILQSDPGALEALEDRLESGTPAEGFAKSDHWAYKTPRKPDSLPAVSDPTWIRNPIDSFILARLDELGLKPNAEAGKARLLRRVSLDLIGLPPTLEEVDSFLADESPEAYEKAVDRLLASPHYGERQAQSWLDLARFADTNGYHIDAPRVMWPYRDWVIDAFNRDLPFDRFTIEQLAGDLLPDPGRSQLIATGFHRNTLFNEEGGIDPEEFRAKAVSDRVGTTATVWMGTTMACVECHEHKFDPFEQTDFYRMYAFFNTVPEQGGGTFVPQKPMIHLLDDDQEEELAEIRNAIAETQQTLGASTPELEEEQTRWEARQREGLDWRPLQPNCSYSQHGAILQALEDGSVLASGVAPATDVYRFHATTDLQRITALRIELLPDKSAPEDGVGRFAGKRPSISEFKVRAAVADHPEQATDIALKNPTANYSAVGGPIEKAVDNSLSRGWVTSVTNEEFPTALFELARPLEFKEGAWIEFSLSQLNPNASTLARVRVSATGASHPVRIPPRPIRNLLAKTSADSGAEAQVEELATYYRSISPALDPARGLLARKEKEEKDLLNSVPYALVMGEMEAPPRETHVLARGDFLRPGKRVEAAVPAIFEQLPSDVPADRMALAKWLVDPEHPLTSRVVMNRLWEQFFGTGIVKTGEDFGTQGEAPTHPDLLDWLAVEFIERGWSMKAMRKLLVTSAAYRQSTRTTAEKLEKDPYNRYLSRGPRFRLDAETLRDNALAIGGLLDRTVGGPSVYPPQPPGIWTDINSKGYGVDEWIESEGKDRFRRGLYTFWRRSSPYASFVTFDAPSREACTVARARTNTPLQALNGLNDPVFVEASFGLAKRALTECESDVPSEKIEYAFRLCLGRKPNPTERDRLLALYSEQLEKFRDRPEILDKIKGTDEAKPAADLDRAKLAAWGLVASVLLNLDETLTKG